MAKIRRVVKAKSPRVKRELEKREPLIIENTKQCLFFKGKKTGEYMRQCLKDIYALKKLESKMLQNRDQMLPFEDILPLERLAQKHDASLFAYTSHNKKRPNNLVLGRMFNHHLLDMVELGVETYAGLQDFNNAKIPTGTKPCMVFCGTQFEDVEDLKKLKSLFIDFFKGVEATEVRLQGFEHALLFTAVEDKVYIRSYRIILKKSGTRIPRVELEEIGPSMDVKIRRTKFASDDLMKRARRQPKQLKVTKVKNVSKDVFGSKLGRIHMTKQDFGKLQTRKIKALKTKKGKSANFIALPAMEVNED